MKEIQLIEFLSTSSDLRHVLNDDEIISLVPHLGIETISAGTILRDEGAPECSLLIIVSGEVRLSYTDTEVNKLNPGQSSAKVLSQKRNQLGESRGTVDSVIARFEVRKFDQFLQRPKSAQSCKIISRLHLGDCTKWKALATTIPENFWLLLPTMR